jgi:hypothetical protein
MIWKFYTTYFIIIVNNTLFIFIEAQLWGCSKPSNINIIQRFRNKVLRGIVDAPWYVRNSDLHRDLNIKSMTDIIKKMAQNHTNGGSITIQIQKRSSALQGSYTATQQDEAIGLVLVRVVIRAKSRA